MIEIYTILIVLKPVFCHWFQILIFKSFNLPVYVLLESRRRELHSLFCLPLSRPVFRRGNVFLFPEDINQNGYLINPHQHINTQPSMYMYCKGLVFSLLRLYLWNMLSWNKEILCVYINIYIRFLSCVQLKNEYHGVFNWNYQ